MPVTQVYQTTKGTIYPTYKKAEIADKLEQYPSLYLEDYKLAKIVEALTTSNTKEPTDETN